MPSIPIENLILDDWTDTLQRKAVVCALQNRRLVTLAGVSDGQFQSKHQTKGRYSYLSHLGWSSRLKADHATDYFSCDAVVMENQCAMLQSVYPHD